MARSSTSDPIEKFRFTVTVISIDIGFSAAIDALQTVDKRFSIVSNSGFQEITLPSVSVNQMSYRENVDNQRFSKGPGLATYTPVILRRGVTPNNDLYNWYRLVNNDSALLSVAQELTKEAIVPNQSEYFRKEVIISSLDREGKTIKQWMLFNAFPIGYKGGDDLDAQSDQKLVEEITLTYEWFLEIEGGVAGYLKEGAKDALQAGISYALDKAKALDRLPFRR